MSIGIKNEGKFVHAVGTIVLWLRARDCAGFNSATKHVFDTIDSNREMGPTIFMNRRCGMSELIELERDMLDFLTIPNVSSNIIANSIFPAPKHAHAKNGLIKCNRAFEILDLKGKVANSERMTRTV
jgi:hypothetical protein